MSQLPENFGDMVAYMTDAKNNGEWSRPSLHQRSETTVNAVRENTDTEHLFRLVLRGAVVIEARRVVGTTDAIHERHDAENDQHIYRISAYGETCMDLRYWLLQAEINDVPLEIEMVSDDARELITEASPPEWRNDIEELLQRYQ